MNNKLSSRISALLSDRDSLNKIIKKDLYQVDISKRSKAFFQCVFELNYAAEELAARPFLNIGPGSFSHPLWRTADKLYGAETWTASRRGVTQPKVDHEWDIYDRKALPLEAGSLRVIYCSHVIEHAFDDDVRFLFGEARRLLAPGGVLRIVCPDADLLARAYVAKDWSYFMHYLAVKTNRRPLRRDDIPKMEEKGDFAEFVLEWVSLLTTRGNPVVCKGKAAIEFLERFSTPYEAFTAASALSSRDLNRTVGGHVNWFNAPKIMAMLQESGFNRVERSGWCQSVAPILRDTALFDRTDPEMSLFVDAVV